MKGNGWRPKQLTCGKPFDPLLLASSHAFESVLRFLPHYIPSCIRPVATASWHVQYTLFTVQSDQTLRRHLPERATVGDR